MHPAEPAPVGLLTRLDGARFAARREHFGAVVFDRELGELLALDEGAVLLLRNASRPRRELVLVFEPLYSEDALEAFLDQWTERGLLDEEGRLQASWSPVPAPGPGVLSAPLRVYLNITNACNLGCRHCVNSSGRPLQEELSTAEVQALIDRLAELFVFELKFAGGEPLMRRDVPELMEHAVERGLAVALTTNGTVLSPALLERLDRIGLQYITVSLEGPDAETHDAVRGPGTFQRAVQGLELLRAHTRHHLNVHFTVHQGNHRRLDEVFRLAERLPVDSVGFTPMRPAGTGKDHPDLWLARKEFAEATRSLLRLANSCSKRVVLPLDPAGDGGRLYTQFGCGAAHVNAGIDAEGYMGPCSFFVGEDWRGHSVRHTDVLEIWRDSPLFRRLRELEGNPQCGSCAHRQVCRGGCRAAALYLTGDLNAPDEHCVFAESFP